MASTPSEVTYRLPLAIEMGKRKVRRHYLNLNLYRNISFHLNNNLKRAFKKIVAGAVPEFHFECYEMHFKVYFPDTRKRDVANVLSIVDKFQTDALVELGYVPEDNYHYLKKVVYEFGGIDTKGKGYVEVTIKESKCD